ncbi:TonB-dependent receptor [Croceicoccus sp. BE223]|uniref:TonB-dependent receptor n=1 Tax=Croceicoccus sp. BE223 TaxID=2817716 RepID=UPI00286631D3|nr:TonB-dependent receptor [Croceicoccus sp. BE223]MDR7101636.1 outer membrane receptor protein involved in Fe transport [Croceicoccus sp. BE223]
MRHNPTRKAAAALFASTAFIAFPAMAQDDPTMSAPSSDEAADSNVIIVTAQKRAESLQDVPISIQAFNGAKLEQHQVASFDDYAKMLPSVSFQSFGPGQSQIYFRGVSSGANANGSHSGPQPSSAIYVDEVPLTTIGGAPDLHIYDMERVEALSGPQGTLYGASSLSGTLRLITNKPTTDRVEGGVDASLTSFGKGRNSTGGSLEGFVNLPLSETVALRTSAFYERVGGYISNVAGSRTYQVFDVNGDLVPLTVDNAAYVEKNFNDVETWGGRAALGIDLDENWTVLPAVIYQKQKSNGTFLFDPTVGDLELQDYTPDYGSDEWYQAMLTVRGKISDWDVTYAGGYFERETDVVQDYSAYTVAYDAAYPSYVSFLDANDENIDPTQTYRGFDKYTKQTHELRLSSPSGNRWQLIAGVFVARQTDRINADYIIPGLAASPYGYAVPGCGDDIFCTRVFRVDRDKAAFLDLTFDITPALSINGGIRYFRTKNSLSGFSGTAGTVANTDLCPPSSDPDLPCDLFDKTVKEDGETHKLNLTYKIDPDAMIYATYSTGFRPGGINRRIGVNPYMADTLDNYEVGVKTMWLDRRLTLNVTGYYEKWKDLQYGLSSAGSLGVISTYNAGNARIKGVEADFNLRVEQFNLSGAATYTDAQLTTDFCPIDASGNPACTSPDVVAAPAGTRLPIQPKFKANLTARQGFDIGEALAFVQGTVNHQSGTRSYLTDFEAGLLGSTKGFTTFDFSLGADMGRWMWEAFVQNAFDKRGILSINTVCVPSICGDFARYYPIRPRMFGVKVGTRFD